MNKKVLNIIGLCSVCAIASAQTEKPNVIIIYTDDMGTLDAGCFGAPDLYTPNIDALAASGVKFTQFYGAPVSSVSRACLMSGQYSKHNGVTGNVGKTGLPLDKETIADRMRANGYRTALCGKWHLGSDTKYAPNARGFDYFWGFRGGCIDSYSHFFYWSGPNRHDLWENETEIYRPGIFFTAGSLEKVRTFIDDKSSGKPFFIYWAVNIPHYPLQPLEKWLDYYSGLENPRKMYAAYMSTFDDYLGELRCLLKARGLEENTIVIFQSDNGHSFENRTFGEGGYCGDYRGGKFSLFEGGIRVPAIISWPGHIPQGEVRNQMAMNIDWFPTILEYCGISAEGADLDGKSLVPMIAGEEKESPHNVLHFDCNRQWAVRWGDWKLFNNVVDVLPHDKKNIIEGLFLTNLKMDPTEKTDYKNQYPDIMKKMLQMRKEYEKSLKGR